MKIIPILLGLILAVSLIPIATAGIPLFPYDDNLGDRGDGAIDYKDGSLGKEIFIQHIQLPPPEPPQPPQPPFKGVYKDGHGSSSGGNYCDSYCMNAKIRNLIFMKKVQCFHDIIPPLERQLVRQDVSIVDVFPILIDPQYRYCMGDVLGILTPHLA